MRAAYRHLQNDQIRGKISIILLFLGRIATFYAGAHRMQFSFCEVGSKLGSRQI
jgi:hypothetical protein